LGYKDRLGVIRITFPLVSFREKEKERERERERGKKKESKDTRLVRYNGYDAIAPRIHRSVNR